MFKRRQKRILLNKWEDGITINTFTTFASYKENKKVEVQIFIMSFSFVHRFKITLNTFFLILKLEEYLISSVIQFFFL